eukprot:7077743-Prymnesium_polylepis.1
MLSRHITPRPAVPGLSTPRRAHPAKRRTPPLSLLCLAIAGRRDRRAALARAALALALRPSIAIEVRSRFNSVGRPWEAALTHMIPA